MAWDPAGAVRPHERQAEHFLAFFVRIAAALIGYGRLAAWPSPSGARAGAYEEAERVARRVEQDAYVVLRLEVRHRRPQGKSVLDG